MPLKIFIGLDQNPKRPDEYSVLPPESIMALSFIFSFASKFTGARDDFVKTDMYEFDKMFAQKDFEIIFLSNKKDRKVKANHSNRRNIFVNVKKIPKKSINGIQDAAKKLIGNRVKIFDNELADFIALENMLTENTPVPDNTGAAYILSQMVFADMVAERIITNPKSVWNKKAAINEAKMQMIHEIHKMMLNAMPSY